MQISQCIKSASIDSRETEILLCYILRVSRSYVLSHPEQRLSPIQLQQWHELVQRRKNGEPIAYIIQQREFWSLAMNVTPATLIPRSETELLVEIVLKNLPEICQFPILELGTGSGAIAIALAKMRPTWQIVATDISDAALHVAKTNAAKHQVSNITFIQSDWYNNLKQTTYTAIISNPPYIAKDDIHLTQGDLPFEPQLALVSGDDGLAALTHIIEKSSPFLSNDGWIFLEHGFDQEAATQQLLKKQHFSEITTIYDLNDLPRVSLGLHGRHE